MDQPLVNPDLGAQVNLLYHFCSLQLPAVVLSLQKCKEHLLRTFQLSQAKSNLASSWPAYLDNFYPLDWFVACACLEGKPRAWDYLFSARAGRFRWLNCCAHECWFNSCTLTT